jgi:excisionase family DNA binding protein
VAKLLRVHPTKILSWIRRGDLTAVNLADHQATRPRFRISRKDLEQFLATRRQMPTAPRQRKRPAVVIEKKYF